MWLTWCYCDFSSFTPEVKIITVLHLHSELQQKLHVSENGPKCLKTGNCWTESWSGASASFWYSRKASHSRFVLILPLQRCSEGDFTPAVNKPFIKNVNIKNNKICSYLVFQWQMFYPLLICIIRRKKHAITAWVLPLGFCKGLYHCGHPKIPLWNILIQKLFCTVNSGEKNWIWGSTYLLYPLILYVLFLILASSFYL